MTLLSRFFPAIITAILGITLSILLFLFIVDFEKTQNENKFERTATEYTANFERQINKDLESLHSIAAFYDNSSFVSRIEFKNFVAHILARTDTFKALEWVPRVPADEREQYEQQARDDGYADFQIKEYSPDGVVTPATAREEYFPVFYLEPLSGNEKVFGFHLNSSEARAASLNRARDTGEMTFSEPLTLVQETEKHYGVLAFVPVYKRNAATKTIAQRQENLQGFVLGVIRIKNVFDGIYASKSNTPKQDSGIDINIYLYNLSATKNNDLLYASTPSASDNLSATENAVTVSDISQGIHTSHELSVGGKKWLMLVKPADANLSLSISTVAWITLLAMLIFSALLTAYIHLAIKKKAHIDILVEKRSRALREGDARIRSIVDTVVDGIVTINAKGDVKSFNPAAENIFGYSQNEVLNRNVNMLMPEPYHREHDGYLHNYTSTGKKKIIGIGREVEGKRKDGSTFPMELAVSEMDIDGEQMFTGIVRDITERKQSDNAIQDNAERIRTILDTVVDGIITFNELGIIESFNPAGANLFGYSLDELQDMHFSVLLTEDAGSKYKYLLEQFISSGASTILGSTIESEGLHSDGSVIPIEFAVNEMWLGGKRHFTSVVRDISERKKVDRMKSEFISTVSHELRTPLTSIRGALSLVLGKANVEFPAKVQHLLETASRNAEQLTYLINDILDLEKLKSGDLELALKAVDIVELSHRALEENESYAQSHNVHLKLNNELNDETMIYVDVHRILQVFANLISNAVKFSPKDDVVSINLKLNNGQLRVSIEDHGEGIPDEFRSKIFARFSQVDSSDSRKKGGTGLGLTITKAIIEQHKGKLDFESQVGQGSKFYFELPLWKEIRETTIPDDRTPRVLVCEDDMDASLILSSLLEQEGISADVAATAESARVLLKKHNYQAMLLDLGLPDTDGLTLIHELRENENTKDLPIIVVSGTAEEGRKNINGEAMNVIDWFQKPFDSVRLLSTLKHVIRDNAHPKILHIEDDLDIIEIVQALMEDIGDCQYATTVKSASRLIENNDYDLIILDIELPDGSGLEILDKLKNDIPVVIFSGQESASIVNAKVAASLTKSRTNNSELISTINHVLQQHKMS